MTPIPRHGTSTRAAFSLVECVLALGIAAVVVLTLLKIVPQTLDAQREANDHSALAEVLRDVHHRIEGQVLREGPIAIGPLFYDADGAFRGSGEEGGRDGAALIGSSPESERFFRAEATLHHIPIAPEEVGARGPDPLAGRWAVTLDLFWPLDEKGEPLGHTRPKTELTWTVSSLTGPDWERIDPAFEPKIEY